MVELIKATAPHVAGFILRGEVTKEDYENLIAPVVKAVAENYEEVNMLIVLHTDVANFTIGAWVQDAIIGLKHLTKWGRIAIVADQEIVEKATMIMDKIIPGHYQSFPLHQQAEALNWVSGGYEAVSAN